MGVYENCLWNKKLWILNYTHKYEHLKQCFQKIKSLRNEKEELWKLDVQIY